MIELTEIAEAREPKSEVELYGALLERIGRVVRVRHAMVETISLNDRASGDTFTSEAVVIDETAGKLLTVGLRSYSVASEDPSGPKIRVMGADVLVLGLEGAGEPRDIDLDLELQIQALLPDGVGWRIIHESAGWEALMRQGETS